MTPERYQRIKQLFQATLEREPQERAAFLAEACAGDEQLRLEVESLLASYQQAETFIESPAVAYAPDLLAKHQSESALGRHIGPYRVIEEIGQGGMGTVYLAARADDEYRKLVAIKLVKRGMDTDFIIQRFRQERQILASLDHPHIARLLDGGTTEDGLPYFVMEYIEGQPIIDYCDSHQLPTSERLKLFRAVCAAVQYAHQNLVVHRDLKPSNILVTADGTPKLLDFGIAKLLNPELSDHTIDPTATAMRLMTPEYASPEQVRGEQITTATDVYSLGVVLYELLTGHRPYQVARCLPHEIARVICEQEPIRPSTAVARVEVATSSDGSPRPTITPEMVSRTRDGQPEKLRRRLAGDLDNMVLMAMRKEPERRYASASQLSEDIRRHLAGLPVTARKDTLGYRTGKFIKRHQVGVAAVALMVVSLIAGMVATIWQARVAKAERARAEKRFNDVRKLANSYLFEMHDGIEKLPGSTKMRELLVKRALEYLDSLASEASGDALLQGELAAAYQKVGDIQGDPYSPNLGNIAGALSSYRKALAIREALAPQSNHTEARRDLAAVYDRIGRIQLFKQDFQGALETARKALLLRESLSGGEPENPSLLFELGQGYELLSDVLNFSGDRAGALENERRAFQLDEKIAAQEPGNLRYRNAAAVQHCRLGVLMAANGERKEGITTVRQAIKMLEPLAAAHADNAKVRRDLAFSHDSLGDLLWGSQQYAESLDHYRQGLRLREALAAADPVNVQARRDLAVSFCNVGYLLAETGARGQEAVETYRQGLSLFEALAASDPNNVMAWRDLVPSYEYFGDVHKIIAQRARTPVAQKIEHWREARSWYQRRVKLTLEMRDRSLARESDLKSLDAVNKVIAECDAALAKLQGSP
jgi:non-specific serine/threonine protein kinase/serine/threonine-protein kinase